MEKPVNLNPKELAYFGLKICLNCLIFNADVLALTGSTKNYIYIVIF